MDRTCESVTMKWSGTHRSTSAAAALIACVKASSARKGLAAPLRWLSVVSHRVWRFVDIVRRLEFPLAGFGWCTMPLRLVQAHLAEGALQ